MSDTEILPAEEIEISLPKDSRLENLDKENRKNQETIEIKIDNQNKNNQESINENIDEEEKIEKGVCPCFIPFLPCLPCIPVSVTTKILTKIFIMVYLNSKFYFSFACLSCQYFVFVVCVFHHLLLCRFYFAAMKMTNSQININI